MGHDPHKDENDTMRDDAMALTERVQAEPRKAQKGGASAFESGGELLGLSC